MLLRLDVVGAGSVTIDAARNEFAGLLSPSTAPAFPSAVVIETRPSVPGAPALEGARDLDSLLWFIGRHAFDDHPATWLWATDRYRLLRWPNLLDASPDDVRMFAALAHSFLSPTELADITGVDIGTARRAINALTLMGVLDTSSHMPPPQPEMKRVRTRGLFSRLRRRLGVP